MLLLRPKGEFAKSVEAFFKKLETPINTATELGTTAVSGRGQLALVGKVTTGMGLACFLMVLASAAGRDRMITAIYAVATTVVGLAFVAAGRAPQAPDRLAGRPDPGLVVGELGGKE